MSKKIRVGIIFGGRSTEHEVSLQSAKNVIEALDKDKFKPVLIAIDKAGKWHLTDGADYLLNADNPKLIKLKNINKSITLTVDNEKTELVRLEYGKKEGGVDVIFPVLHGTLGEDGTIQGLLKLTNIPFVGSSVLGSAVGMDKDVMKRLLRDAGIPIAKFFVFQQNSKGHPEPVSGSNNKQSLRANALKIPTRKSTGLSPARNDSKTNFQMLKKHLGIPLFVKPANAGSSVGVSKVENESEFEKAIKEAFKYDSKILIEQGIKGREIEVSVLGNQDLKVSLPGEVIPTNDFYSYEAKYIDEDGARLEIPAKLTQSQIKMAQETALKAYKTLCCEGMARVDMFLTDKGKVYLNEINTIPGFTKISMYPKLWEVSGLPYKELITKLIELAIERHKKEQKLKTSY